MKHNRAGLVLLASVVVIATVLAGCTGVQDAASPEPTPPAGEDIPEAGGNDSVAAGNNRFAFDLYQELRNDPAYAEENLFFSPYSISSALAITYEGARGRTADEIRAVFHLPVDDTARRKGFWRSMRASTAKIPATPCGRQTPCGLRRPTPSSRTTSKRPDVITLQTSPTSTSPPSPRLRASRSTGGWRRGRTT